VYQPARCESPPIMSAVELHAQLLELQAERALAEDTGVARIGAYMDDLEREIARSHAAFVGAAVTEIASFRAQLSGPQHG
jgi:hypothetical protein